MNTKYLVLIALLIQPGLAAAQSTPPYNPSGLVLAPTDAGINTLVSWRRGSPDSVSFLHYQVQRSEGIGFEDLGPQITDSATTTYLVPNAGTGFFGYSYQVQEVYTVDGQLHTGTSNIVRSWHHDSGESNAEEVANLRAEILNGGQVRLTWDQGAGDDLTGHSIAIVRTGLSRSVSRSTISFTDPSPVPGIYNQYTVRAARRGVFGDGSLISVLTPPVIPDNVEIVLGADGEFTLNWDPPIGATEYKIEQGSVTP